MCGPKKNSIDKEKNEGLNAIAQGYQKPDGETMQGTRKEQTKIVYVMEKVIELKWNRPNL